MSSVCYGGSVRMNPEIKENERDPMFDGGYPHKMPQVYLEGWGEVYNRQYCFDWDDDSVVVVRDKLIVKYTRSTFVELLAKNEEGQIVWMDGRRAPYSDCWEGEYLDEECGACEYTIEEYNLETLKKRKCKVVLDKETDFDIRDYRSLSNFVDADKLTSHFEIKDGVLLEYVGHDKALTIPEGVAELRYNALGYGREFESITIPSTLVKIYYSLSEHCKVKEINVSEDNPKYYTKDGCLIDKETGTLVWAFAAENIPDDDSIKEIGYCAFAGRKDIKRIVVPDNITKIGPGAFRDCVNLVSIVISDSTSVIDGSVFSGCESLLEIKLPNALEVVKANTFSGCISLECIEIPDSVHTIEYHAFGGCSSLRDIHTSGAGIDLSEVISGKSYIRNGDEWTTPIKTDDTPSVNFAGFSF